MERVLWPEMLIATVSGTPSPFHQFCQFALDRNGARTERGHSRENKRVSDLPWPTSGYIF
jgi:hypothetical protein